MCTADSVDLSEEMMATGSVGLGFSCGPRVPRCGRHDLLCHGWGLVRGLESGIIYGWKNS